MPTVLMTDIINSEIGAQIPWPNNVQLYQPEETNQILMPDNANCLSVQAYLRMCGLKYEVVYHHNAEYMSPSGRVPFIKCGAFVIPELEGIIAHVHGKDISLSNDLDSVKKADLRAFMALVNNILLNAELYLTWYDSEVYKEVTWQRNSYVHPFPLKYFITYMKKRIMCKRLTVLSWTDKSKEDVFTQVDICCKSLSDRLDQDKFFFGDNPTELDALVFGHVFTILTTPLPSTKLAGIVRSYPNLVEHCQRIEDKYFQNYKEPENEA